MRSWKSKYKRGSLIILCVLFLLSMVACSSKVQEGEQSIDDNRSSSESNGQQGTSIDKAPSLQYVYSSETITFTEYGDRVDVLDVAGKRDRVYILMEVQNWDEGAADDEPSEVFIRSCPACWTGVKDRYLIRLLCRRRQGT